MTRMLEQNPLPNLAFGFFTLAYIATAFEAFSLGNIPITWLANIIAVIIVVFLAVTKKNILHALKGKTVFGFLVFWAILVTLFSFWGEKMEFSGTTTPIWLFVLLRIFTLISFFCVYRLVSLIQNKQYRDRLIDMIIITGTIISLFSLYVYMAQFFQLPFLAGNRLGTDGRVQTFLFSFNDLEGEHFYNRAFGTFREPSHLAEWLLLPFFLSLMNQSKIKALIIGLAITLTISLGAIIAAFLGYTILLLTMYPRDLGKRILSMILVGIALLTVWSVLPVSTGGAVIKIIYKRIIPIATEVSLKETNRSHVVTYSETVSIPLLGNGLGIANIHLAKSLEINIVPSFLSLYRNHLYSLGPVGLIFLLYFLSIPLLVLFKYRRLIRDNPRIMYLFSVYIAWLIIFAVRAEELYFQFGVVYGLVCYSIPTKDSQHSML